MTTSVETVCSFCGRARSEWKANQGLGLIHDGKVYCCEGCARGEQCRCTLLQTATRPMSRVDKTEGI